MFVYPPKFIDKIESAIQGPIVGHLVDRYGPRPVNIATMAQLLLFKRLFTTVESAYPVAWAMVGDIFGRKRFAKIRGYIVRGDS